MNKEELITEICKRLLEKDYYELNYFTIRKFLEVIQDTTVLGDILSDLKS